MQKALISIGLAILVFAGLWWLSPNEAEYRSQNKVSNKETTLLPIELEEKRIVGQSDEELVFRLPKEFNISIAADGLGKARFMAESPDGRIFVPDLVDYQLSHQGRLFVLGDFNEETHKFETKHTYLSNLRGPNSVAFYKDENGQDWLYLALTAHLIRYPYKAGDIKPSGEGEIIYNFPNKQSPGEESVVWHITRTLLFHDDELYIAIGSGCNSCEHLAGDLRGMVMVMNPDATNARVYGDGLRNSVGMTWGPDGLYATENGVDHLGNERPDEMMYKVEEGKHYGWPYCYEVDGVIYEDTSSIWDEAFSCESVPLTFAAFPPRSAPLGIEYFKDFHPVLNDSFLVALHGSFTPGTMSGYEIVRVDRKGNTETFMDGFQKEDASRIARPVDIFQKDENSFFMTDDFGGRIFYLWTE